jgi:UDP-N-acetylmuramoylalanine--D-glutamate ligase
MQGERVLVLGLGDSGLAMARWCARAGAAVRVWDSRAEPPQAATLAAELPDSERLALVFVRDDGSEDAAALAQALDGVTRVLKSPGLAPYDARITPLLREARTRGLPVQGELDLFAQALAALKAERGYAPKLLAITGTNGKTTTTAMTALLVERAGKRVAMAGNVGPTMLDTLAAALAQDAARAEDAEATLPEVWVLELSSFQLEGGGTGVVGFEPDAATVLNLTQDHLDWHGSMDAYARAKARVFGAGAAQGTMVLNRDDALVEAMAPVAPAPAKGRGAPKVAPRPVVRFGLDAPRAPGDFGLVQEGGMAWLVRALPDEEGVRRKPGEDVEIHLQRLMPADALRVRGRHNAANALAALALASAIGCPLAPMLHGLREYVGEPHRVQWVGNVGDTEAYDDSKGTNVGATVAALDGLGADKAPARLVVILGGDGKGQDFAPLAAPVRRHARAVALIGRDAAAVEAALAGTGVPMQRHDTLPDATAWCFAQAQPGDAVLLSPACASLDMFRNYAHRAEVFVAAVQALALERGQA